MFTRDYLDVTQPISLWYSVEQQSLYQKVYHLLRVIWKVSFLVKMDFNMSSTSESFKLHMILT